MIVGWRSGGMAAATPVPSPQEFQKAQLQAAGKAETAGGWLRRFCGENKNQA
jgi:hypothetical protein